MSKEGRAFHEAAGTAEAYAQIGRTKWLTERGLRRAWFQVGPSILREVSKATLARPRAGRVYRIRTFGGRTTFRHVASRPGESHANMRGPLRRSRGWKPGGSYSMEIGYGVSSSSPERAPRYARAIEFGRKAQGSQPAIAARPSIHNAIGKDSRNTENYLGTYIVREF